MNTLLYSLLFTVVVHLFILQCVAQESDGVLVFVEVVHRHGDRSPVYSNPNSLLDWQDVAAPGELTAIGVAQHKAFGAMLHAQYVTAEPLLAADQLTINQQLYVRSTDLDRTLTSVQSLLSTLVPHIYVPVHTVSNQLDSLLQAVGVCPSYSSEATVNWAVTDQIILSQYSTLLTQVEEITGFDVNLLGPTALLLIAYDNWVCLTSHDFNVSDAYTNVVPKLRSLTMNQWYNDYVSTHLTTDQRGPVGGVLALTTLQNMEQIIMGASTNHPLSSSPPSHTPHHRPYQQQQQQHRSQSATTTPTTTSSTTTPLSSSSPSSPPPPAPTTTSASIFWPAFNSVVNSFVDKQQNRILQPRPETTHNSKFKSRSRHHHAQIITPAKSVTFSTTHPITSSSSSSTSQQQQLPVSVGDGPPSETTKMVIYSAHDTTLISLFTALELIEDNESEFLLPPYASSVVFELRQLSNGTHMISAKYGYPLPTGSDPTTQNGWTYHQEPINLRCATPSSSCMFFEWRKYMQTILSNVNNPNAGCCYLSPAFYELGCNNMTVSASTLAPDCQLYRMSCPISTCSVMTGSVLDEASLQCKVAVSGSTVQPLQPQTDDSSHSKYKDYTIGLAVVAGLLFLALVVTCLFYRSKIKSISTGNLSERLLNSDVL